MNENHVKPGLRVITGKLGDTTGMMIADKHVLVRQEGISGMVLDYVPGHGGDVWFVAHDNSPAVGAYVFNEFEPAEQLEAG